MLGVPSQLAEDSIALLNITVANHRSAILRIPERLHKSRLGGVVFQDRATVQRYGTLERLVAITESFVHERLGRHVESHLGTLNLPPISLVVDEALVNAAMNWNNAQRAYREWIEVKLPYSEIEGLVEARNAIAHGLGTLTRKQKQKRIPRVAKLAEVGIAIDGDRLVITEDQLDIAKQRCATFILEVDELVTGRDGDISGPLSGQGV